MVFFTNTIIVYDIKNQVTLFSDPLDPHYTMVDAYFDPLTNVISYLATAMTPDGVKSFFIT